MSRRATKAGQKRAERRKPASKTTRGRRSSPAPAADDDDEVDDQGDDQGEADGIELFIRSPPTAAERVVVVASTPKGDQIVQDRSLAEARRAPVQLALGIYSACNHWAVVEGRRTVFRATWMRGTAVLSAHQWALGDGRDPTALDGTVESFLVQQQRFAEAQNRLHLDSFEMVQESWQKLFSVLNKRMDTVEKDNDSLRERLRKVDEVAQDIAVAEADMERRGRTAEMFETKLLPLAQAYLVQQMQAKQQAAAVAAAAAGGGGPIVDG